MGKRKTISVHFPVGGVNRRKAFREQPPFTAPDALNVRPDSANGRERGGTRPGLVKAYDEQLGSGSPVRLLNSVDYVSEDSLVSWTDLFDGASISSIWAAHGTQTIPSVIEDLVNVSYNTEVGAVRDTISAFDASQEYEISLYIAPYFTTHWGKYKIYARMNNSTPVATTDGVVVELDLTGGGGAYDGSIKVYVAGVETAYAFTAGTHSYPLPGWFKVLVNGNTISAYWRGTLLKSQSVSAASGSRVGFGINCTLAGGVCLVDTFRIQYRLSTNNSRIRTFLVASAGGTLYRDDYAGRMKVLSTTCALGTDKLLQSAEYLQKLYIADISGYVRKGTDGARGTANNKFDATGTSDWTIYGISAANHVLILTGSTGVMTDGVYRISSVAAGELTLGSDCATGSGTGTSSFRIVRAPKIYDPGADSLEVWTASSGTIPQECPLIAVYKDRIYMAGSPTAPHLWYACKQGDPLNWNYYLTPGDPQRAVAGSLADAGRTGRPITALAAHDDYMIMSNRTGMFILRGDPCYGGSIDRKSEFVGIIAPNAWCWGPSSELIFLSQDGLYLLAPEAQGAPQRLSREVLPDELVNIDTDVFEPQLAYDIQGAGIHIFLTEKTDQANVRHWFFDWDQKGFWPQSFQNTHEPTSMMAFRPPSNSDSAVLLGGRDGYVRRFHYCAETDEGSEIESWIKIGPIPLGRTDSEVGILRELNMTLAAGSGFATWSVHPAETAEGTNSALALKSGTLSSGKNYRVHPMARGRAIILRLENYGTTRRWEFESSDGEIEYVGMQR